MESTKSKVRRAHLRGLKQREIAAELGISRTLVRKCLKGWKPPRDWQREKQPEPEPNFVGWDEDPLDVSRLALV